MVEDEEFEGPWGAAPKVLIQLVNQCFASEPSARPDMYHVVEQLDAWLQAPAHEGRSDRTTMHYEEHNDRPTTYFETMDIEFGR